ncbi:Cytokine receptor-like factor 3, variant 2 [Homalodisca vitripennis]|nr:Cytokine receptor-like factor 3, variant 2 [Homalodisca vitripennis]
MISGVRLVFGRPERASLSAEVEDRGVDDHTYLLQLAAGFHPTPVPNRSAAVYRDVYRGPDTSCVVRDVRPGAPYTLRVCGCGEQGQWGAWSLPRLATTHQLAFRWSDTNPHYSTSVEGKIATKLDNVVLLLSSIGKQFGPQHSIEFTVLECPEHRQPCEGVGVADLLEETNTLVQRGCVALSAFGSIYVDGVEKTTKLPALTRGSRVTFTCEPLTANRVRLQVDSGNKAVTYDWRVSNTTLSFIALCTQPGWKLMVE